MGIGWGRAWGTSLPTKKLCQNFEGKGVGLNAIWDGVRKLEFSLPLSEYVKQIKSKNF